MRVWGASTSPDIHDILLRKLKMLSLALLIKVRGVKIFKTYMNMMSEKVLILLCDVHSSLFSFIFPSIAHTHTRAYVYEKFLSLFVVAAAAAAAAAAAPL
jgi:hypothetical protein